MVVNEDRAVRFHVSPVECRRMGGGIHRRLSRVKVGPDVDAVVKMAAHQILVIVKVLPRKQPDDILEEKSSLGNSKQTSRRKNT